MYHSPKGQSCFIVALEGGDRLGKSTQASLLEHRMDLEKIKGTVEKCPYKDGITYDRIYEMLRTGDAVRYPVVFQTLQGVNRRYVQYRYLPALVEHFKIVVFDRWNLSTIVYGTETDVPTDTTACILQGIVDPDLTFVFDGEPFKAPDTDDSYEASPGFQRRIRARFKEWALAHPETAVLINANLPQKQIAAELWDTLLQRFHAKSI